MELTEPRIRAGTPDLKDFGIRFSVNVDTLTGQAPTLIGVPAFASWDLSGRKLRKFGGALYESPGYDAVTCVIDPAEESERSLSLYGDGTPLPFRSDAADAFMNIVQRTIHKDFVVQHSA